MSGLRVLLVEDNESDAELVVRELRRGFGEVVWRRVETLDTLREAFATQSWDVVLCDWSLPQLNALTALAVAKEGNRDVPFIIVSGVIGEESAVDAMRAGARDYVLKDKLSRLVPAVERERRESQTQRARKHAEEALRTSEARFARLSESGIMGITLADISGNVHEANDAFLDLIGYSRAELEAGLVKWSRLTPADRLHLSAHARELLKNTGTAPPWETEYLHKNGSRVPVLVAVAMLDAPMCITVVSDLSAKRKAEEALKRTEEQLRQAQKMEAIGILAGGVAHDFNNILTVILSYTEMLLADLHANDPIRDDINEIHTAGERATALTRQLLAFSRQQLFEPRVLNLNDIVLGMDKMLRRIIREDVNLVLTTAADLGKIRGDAGQLEQIVMNLAVNARDAMPEGGRLTVETGNVDFDDEFVREHLGVKPGHYVMLSVSDTGVGMDKATQARIFEPFFTTKEKGRGTGLGLSTVFGIVEQSGGSVWVYSELGRGTTFKVYLPRTDDAVAKAEVTREPTTLRGSETLLLVEDEDQIRTVAKEILERHGYHVLGARNAGEALLACEQHAGDIELLVTDVVMPQMNGKQLADRLRPLRPKMKVLFLSGYTDGALVGELAAGSSFLQKPITPATLTRKVREVLGVAPKE